MPANPLLFKDAEDVRDAITSSQQWQIADAYKQWSKEIAQKAEEYAHGTTPSSKLMEQQLKDLMKSVDKARYKTIDQVTGTIQNNMYTTANTLVESNATWLTSLGFDSQGVAAAFGNVPTTVVQNLITGNVYKGGWNLSDAIWGSNEQTMKQLYNVVAAGVAQNMPTYDIAKLLEQYVDPSAAKQWNLKAPDGRYIYKGKVDYNAQRLARTLVQHTYQQTFQAVTKNNPFIHDYIWSANGSRVCPLCRSRDGVHFDKNNLPLDHPNGMCVIIPNMDSMDKIAKQLADWVDAPDGTYPGIDNFASKLSVYQPSSKASPAAASAAIKAAAYPGTNPASVTTGAEFAAQYGTSSGAKFNYWYSKLTPEAKAVASTLKAKSGMTWQQWYEKNVYKPKVGAVAKVATTAKAKSGTLDVSSISTSSWITGAKSQTESQMVASEARNFAAMNNMQVGGLKRYTGSSYEEMNSYLRHLAVGMTESQATNRSGISPSQKTDMLNAMSGLKKVATTEELFLRRGTDLGDLAGMMQGDFQTNKSSLYGKTAQELNDMFAGHIGTYAGFTSTSSIWDRGFDGEVEVVFHAPTGTQGSSVMSISQFGPSEGEFILNAGTRVQIVKVEESDGHKGSSIRAYMEILGVDENLAK